MTVNFGPQPAVYRIYLEHSSHQELLELYSDEILMGACTSTIEPAMVDYISRIVEPVGWKAVWRATKQSSGLCVECDFLVEVLDVSLDKLQATVCILEPLECPGADQIQGSSELELLMNSSFTPEVCVPIIELYPVSEGDEEETLYLRTAVAIEHVRTFYKYLWRPWDEDEDDDVFSEKYLSHRLKFFLDLKNEVIPESLAMQAETILEEGWKLREELDSITQDMQASDSERELDEEDVTKLIHMRLKMEELQKQMELMENPFVRTWAMTKEISIKSKNSASDDGPIIHIVGKSFSFRSIKELDLNENDTVEFHHNPQEAIGSASNGDTVLIFPGVYKCGAFMWLEDNITVKGLGMKTDDVVLEGLGGSGDILINCNSSLLQFENLSLQPSKDARFTVMIHSGKLVMRNCAVYGGTSCMLLLPGAKAEMTGCDFLRAKCSGIQLRHSSSLILSTCKISHCKGKGIIINYSMNWTEADGYTELAIHETKIADNQDDDVVLECHPDQDYFNDSITWDIIDKVPWLKVSLTGTCELGTLGLQYLMQSKGSPVSPPKDYMRFMESVDANHLRWSSVDELEDAVKDFGFGDQELMHQNPNSTLIPE